jgi:hypothetical protein
MVFNSEGAAMKTMLVTAALLILAAIVARAIAGPGGPEARPTRSPYGRDTGLAAALLTVTASGAFNWFASCGYTQP